LYDEGTHWPEIGSSREGVILRGWSYDDRQATHRTICSEILSPSLWSQRLKLEVSGTKNLGKQFMQFRERSISAEFWLDPKNLSKYPIQPKPFPTVTKKSSIQLAKIGFSSLYNSRGMMIPRARRATTPTGRNGRRKESNLNSQPVQDQALRSHPSGRTRYRGPERRFPKPARWSPERLSRTSGLCFPFHPQTSPKL
jgi:hypothetical protein